MKKLLQHISPISLLRWNPSPHQTLYVQYELTQASDVH